MIETSSIFLVIFLTALGLLIVSLIMGVADVPLHGLDLHLHLGHGPDGVHAGPHLGSHGLDAHAGSHGAGGAMSPFNLATVLAFATWFGGAGYILAGHLALGTLLALVLAAGVGLVGAGIVFVVLARVLLPGQTPYLSSEDFRLEGMVGRLAVGIREGGTGELVYSQNGRRFVASAKSEDGRAISSGTEVVVVRREEGIVYVQTFEQFLKEEGA